ncbi:MAG: hypothetical protein EXR71_12495 [Myxococcales bacterium]|nr:hypothetical protein [Myxococcales bacterium]
MGSIRIRTDGVELDVADEHALGQMLADGRLGPRSERWDGEVWRALAVGGGVPDDPWSAWNDVDDSAAEAALSTMVRADEPLELPIGAVVPMPQPIVVLHRGATSVAPAQNPPRAPNLAGRNAPSGESPPPAAAPRSPPAFVPRPEAPGPGGLLIDFPIRETPILRRNGSPEQVPLLRPLRVVGMIAALLVVVGGVWGVAEMTRPPVVASAMASRTKSPAAADPLAGVEMALRAVKLGAVKPVRKPGDLDDALAVEFQKLGVDVVSLRAPVTTWRGRKDDDPTEAQVHVVFRASGDLNRDLGAIALSVGRYKLHYQLTIAPFEVVMQSAAGRSATTLDPARAERFAQGRISLSEMMAAP